MGDRLIRRARVFTWGERGTLVALEDDQGVLGVGEATPHPAISSESPADCRAELVGVGWAGLEIPTSPKDLALPADVATSLSASARFAAEGALACLAASRASSPLHTWLAPNQPTAATMQRSVLIGRVGDAGSFEAGLAATRRGAVSLKLKRSGSVGDKGRTWLARLREAIGPGPALRIDFNGSLPAEDLDEELEALARLGVALVEEPVGGEALAKLSSAPLPVVADESLGDPELADRLLGSSAIAGVVLKPTLLGGLARCMELARRARELEKRVIVTHTFEGPVGLAIAAELALALAPGSLEPGLDRHDGLGHFPAWDVRQVPADEAVIRALETPGIGLQPADAEALFARTNEVFRWTRST